MQALLSLALRPHISHANPTMQICTSISSHLKLVDSSSLNSSVTLPLCDRELVRHEGVVEGVGGISCRKCFSQWSMATSLIHVISFNAFLSPLLFMSVTTLSAVLSASSQYVTCQVLPFETSSWLVVSVVMSDKSCVQQVNVSVTTLMTLGKNYADKWKIEVSSPCHRCSLDINIGALRGPHGLCYKSAGSLSYTVKDMQTNRARQMWCDDVMTNTAPTLRGRVAARVESKEGGTTRVDLLCIWAPCWSNTQIPSPPTSVFLQTTQPCLWDWAHRYKKSLRSERKTDALNVYQSNQLALWNAWKGFMSPSLTTFILWPKNGNYEFFKII